MLARRHFSLLAAAAFGALSFVKPPARPTITIGAVEILTGPNNKYGLAIKNGFDLALDEVNKAGGVLGRPSPSPMKTRPVTRTRRSTPSAS